MKTLIFCLFGFIYLTSCGQLDADHRHYDETVKYLNSPVQLSEAPELFLSSAHTIRDVALSGDGTRMLYTMQSLKFRKSTVVQRVLKDGEWISPQLVSFAGRYRDLEPFFHPDGTKLFFASDRPDQENGEPADFNIWYVDYQNGQFGEPVKLDSNVNQSGNEFYPSVAMNGNLYFTAERQEGKGSEDIFVSYYRDGNYTKALPLDSVNSVGYEFNAYISPDESLLISTVYGRADDHGKGDLYVFRKLPDGQWDSGTNLGSLINGPYLDYSPFLDINNQILYFSSEREGFPASGKDIPDYRTWMELLDAPRNGTSNVYAIHWKLNSLPLKTD